jgi:hypothetical protein
MAWLGDPLATAPAPAASIDASQYAPSGNAMTLSQLATPYV